VDIFVGAIDARRKWRKVCDDVMIPSGLWILMGSGETPNTSAGLWILMGSGETLDIYIYIYALRENILYPKHISSP